MWRITGDERYKRAFLHHRASIRRFDVHNTGAFSSGEQATGNPYTEAPIETCCTIAWTAVMIDALRITADPRIADDLELTFYNAICAAQHPSGFWWTYDTPMNGRRAASQHTIVFQARPGSPELNCCSVNGPRGLGMLSEWAVMQISNRLVLNYLGPMTFSNLVRVKGNYPFEDQIEIETKSSLSIRIPAWATNAQVRANGVAKSATAGSYFDAQAGDRIELKLKLPVWYAAGEREQVGRVSLYRGPLLLAYDQKHNAFDDAAIPGVDLSHLEITTQPGDWLVADLSGLRLCDFASAGSSGTYYRTWLRATNFPALGR